MGNASSGANKPYVFDGQLLHRHPDSEPGALATSDLQSMLLHTSQIVCLRHDGSLDLVSKSSFDGNRDDDDDDGDDDDDEVPDCTNTDTTQFTQAHLRLLQLAVGGVLTGAAPHFHGYTVNVLAQGVRLWYFAKPSSPHSYFMIRNAAQWWREGLADMLASHQQRKEKHAPMDFKLVLQWSGDIVVIPDSWSHATLNLADTVAVALEYGDLM